ncbi:site-specific integrase [Limnothrix sp. FACHB-1083]|uniref:site-specific integrase n=1 Tax=unclassified Limnothrix TaxID=2632864 RepID=UPI0016807B51|nr:MULTISPECIES: site-specific integrase [unclassified Limnothrix]MBD2159566.1 site-specific integrase [Limnothrix sp. FACHB-1083]MBD2190268.1 site-specific integrase [Limnothrix sp. FACHB-1088]
MSDAAIARLAQANGRLKRDKVKCSIVLIRGLLSLQATLPPLPDSLSTEFKQRKIALGAPCTTEGVSYAERRARELGRSLRDGSFNWGDWRPKFRRSSPGDTCGEWIDRFEQDYWQRRPKNPKSLTTWRYDYQKVFDRLPAAAPLTAETLKALVLSTEPDSRTRQRTVRILQALAKFADLAIDLKPYQGGYSIHHAAPRDLPTDREIEAAFDRIPSKPWRWVFGTIAAYGLRPHEVFHLKLAYPPRLDVLDGKTKSRIAFPLLPEWFDRWDLATILLPKCSGRNNTDLGNRVTHAFKRYGVPFPPYYLRHAWAVRAIGQLDVSLAAQQMGHSLEVHARVYQHWISAEVHRQAWEAIAQKMPR